MQPFAHQVRRSRIEGADPLLRAGAAFAVLLSVEACNGGLMAMGIDTVPCWDPVEQDADLYHFQDECAPPTVEISQEEWQTWVFKREKPASVDSHDEDW